MMFRPCASLERPWPSLGLLLNRGLHSYGSASGSLQQDLPIPVEPQPLATPAATAGATQNISTNQLSQSCSTAAQQLKQGKEPALQQQQNLQQQQQQCSKEEISRVDQLRAALPTVAPVVQQPQQGPGWWQASYQGNVPTAWWRTVAAASSSSSSSLDCSSDFPTNTPQTWADMVQQSQCLQDQFRLVGPSSSHRAWTADGWMSGRQLQPKPPAGSCQRQLDSAPRAAVSRLAVQQVQHRLHVALGTGSSWSRPRMALTSRAKRKAISKAIGCTAAASPSATFPALSCQQQQQQLACNTTLLESREGHIEHEQVQEQPMAWSQQQQQLQQQQQSHRFTLRSHPRAAAAAAAACRRGWRARGWHPSRLDPGSTARSIGWMPSDSQFGSSSSSNLFAVGFVDIVPRGLGGEDPEARQVGRAIMDVATAGTVTHCCPERDHQGRISVPLPRSCRGGAPCGASSSSSSRSSSGSSLPGSPCVAGLGCDLQEAAGRRRLAWTKQWLHGGSQSLAEEQQQQQQLGHGCASSGSRSNGSWTFNINDDNIPAGFAQHWHLFQQLQLRQQQLELQYVVHEHLVGPLGVRHGQQQATGGANPYDSDSDNDSSMEWSYDSDEEEGGEFDCEDDNESESNSDDDVGDGLSPRGVVAEPHIFRNELGIIYGFWSKAPLG